jgi:hypothetical protein
MRIAVILLSLFLIYIAGPYTGPASACSNTFDVRSYGAVGNGIASDTRPLQSAIIAAQAAGCGTVLGHAPDTYLVSLAGTKYFSNLSYGPYKYSLAIPSNVTLNLQGGTIMLAPNQNASLIVNGLDTGDIVMFGVTNLQIQNVATNNALLAGIIIDNINQSSFDQLTCNTSYGDCFEFGAAAGPPGSSFANWTVRNSTIGSVSAQNCLGISEPDIRPGNSFVGTLINVHIASITATNCAAGIKIQNTSSGVAVNNAYSYGGVNGTNNSGFKVQGTPAADNGFGVNLMPQNVSVGYVESDNQVGAGLFIQDAANTTVATYLGDNNGTGGTYPDV